MTMSTTLMQITVRASRWLAAGALLSACGLAAAGDLRLQIAGDEEVVFSWRRDRCSKEHIPDSPARAFRTAQAEVRLMAGHYTNQFMVGKSINSVKPSCPSAFSASMRDDPEAFDTRTWLQTFYTEDGKTIYALGSADYHGTWFNHCTGTNPANQKCWRSAIVLAKSHDGGKTFTSAPAPQHVIARPPSRFQPDEPGPPPGFFTTSNIVKRDGAYYTIMRTFGFAGQPAGNCLLRTTRLDDPESWRAWDGRGFTVKFANTGKTYRACEPIPGLRGSVSSLIWHEASRQFVAVTLAAKRHRRDDAEQVQVEFRYSTSDTLYQWSSAKSLWTDSSPWCPRGAIAPASYPSIIDPSSEDRNFGTMGGKAYLYFTRYNSAKECRMNLDRDLVRVPIRVVNGP